MPWTIDQARKLVDGGVMLALSVLVVFAIGLALHLAYRYLRKKIEPEPAAVLSRERMRPCDGCIFADDWRSPNELIGHRLFGYIRLARASMLPNLPIRDLGRRKLFVDILDSRFAHTSEMALVWIRNNLNMLNDMHSDTLESEMLGLIGDIIAESEGASLKVGAPPIVIERYRYWENSHIAHVRSEIHLVCESEWSGGMAQRMGFILSVFEQFLKTTVIDAERTLGSLNGGLTGLTYKGLVIGPCDHSKQ